MSLPPTVTVAAMWLSSITSAGKTSPDIDQYPQWHGNRKDVEQWPWVPRLSRFLLWVGPKNHGDPIDHRRFTHWWGLPAIAGALLVAVGVWLPDRVSVPPVDRTELLPWVAVWVAWFAVVAAGALVTGWASHLVGDAPFGKRSRNRGPGIPLLPWWGHKGMNLKSNGWLAHLSVWLLFVPGAAATWTRFDVVGETARACLGG